MAESTQPGKAPIGIIKGPAPKTPPQTQTVVKTADQLLREAAYREGYNKGLHDKSMKNFWHGALAMLVCVSIGAFFTYMIEGANREQNMIESRVAVGAAISNAKLLSESEAMKAPVVEPEGQK